MGKIIGIDLGTTNSCVSVMENGKPSVIANQEGARTTPSIVAFTKTGERLVGEPAKRQTVINAERTISTIKRHMGTDYKITIDDKQYSPQQISAMIIQKLKADAESYLGESVTGAVITVPAYFNDAQRQATRDAGKIAGIDVKRIINEPTAAALTYALDNEKEQVTMVYDLGGGNFSVSIINIGDGVVDVMATNGDTHLGGDDFDERITQWMIDEFKKAEGVDLSDDKMALQRLKEAAERAKKELSSTTTTNINLPFIAATVEGPKHFDTNLTRAKFDELTYDLVERTAVPVQNAMKDAGLTNADIEQVLLVGGSTRIPAVQDKVRQLTGKEPSKSLHPDECVAIGASILGGKLAGDVGAGKILRLDVIPMSLSIETKGGLATRLIERNSTIPTKKSLVFTTVEDNQTAVDINIVQGEGQFAKENQLLGHLRLDGILPACRCVPEIEITLDIDADGIANVSAKDLETGKEQHIILPDGSDQSGRPAGDTEAGEIQVFGDPPLSLSNETKGGLASRLSERNSTIPTNVRKETVVKMNCIKCGQPLAEGAKFCQSCGMRVEKRQIFCINCGARLESPSARFCPYCGISIDQNQERQTVNSAKNDTTQSGVNHIKNNTATETGRLLASLDMVTMVVGGSKKASGPFFVYDDRIEFRKEKIYSAGSTIAAMLLTVVVVICLQYFFEVSLGGLWVGLIAGGLAAGMNYLYQGKQNPVDVYTFHQITNVSVFNNKFNTLVITVNSGVGNRKIGFNPDAAHKQEIQNIANLLQSCLHEK